MSVGVGGGKLAEKHPVLEQDEWQAQRREGQRPPKNFSFVHAFAQTAFFFVWKMATPGAQNQNNLIGSGLVPQDRYFLGFGFSLGLGHSGAPEQV